jgi:hypothetical protein
MFNLRTLIDINLTHFLGIYKIDRQTKEKGKPPA